MIRHAGWIVGGVGALATAALLVPAAADWLVTRDGGRIETDGPWRVDNRLVVFKQPDGTYASVRLTEVDLEASEQLTREMAERARAPEPSPEPHQAAIRLTEKDLPPVRGRGPAASAQGGAPAASDTKDDAGTGESLQIVSWREVSGPNSEGIEFVGNVRNVTDRMALGVAVNVVLFDERGEEAQSANAVLTSPALPPGQAAGFRASFPGVYQYARAEFRTSGDLVLTSDSATGDEAKDASAGEGSGR